MSRWHQLSFKVVNVSTAPVWLAMIIAPRSALTRRLVALAAPLFALLGASYTAFLAVALADEDGPPNFLEIEGVRDALQRPAGLLAGWTHYIAFDLFVGRWIYETALEEGRPARLSLLLTWWAGPLGLSLFLARDRLPAALR
jgi:hypothetical protein